MTQGSRKTAFDFSFLRRLAEREAQGLPALIMNARNAAQSIMTGEHAQRRPGSGEKFWQFRDYHPGDRPQDIDWRQSAKSDRVFIRQKEWQTAQTVYFWCAGGPGMNYKSRPPLPTKHEAAVTLALALGILLAQGGERMAPLDGSLKAGRSELTLEKMGRHLLKTHDSTLPPARPVPQNAGLVLIGDFLDLPEQVDNAFAPLAARSGNGLVVQVLDPAELNLPFTGRTIFEHPASHAERHHIANVDSVRAAYQERMENHRAALRSFCRRHEWHMLLHPTDRPLRETLLEAWSLTAESRA